MNSAKRNMLVFDSAYTREIMIQRKVEILVTGRDLGGYFDHIWTVHPVASLLSPKRSPERFGSPATNELAPRHTLIEGKIGRYRALSWFAPLNFLIAQVELIRLLLRLVREKDIRIVRAEDQLYNGLLALIVARLRKLPLIIGVWGNPGEVRGRTKRPLMPRLFRKIWVEEILERFVLMRADRVLSQNYDNRSYILKVGVPEEKTSIFRLGNLIQEEHFSDPAIRPDGTRDLSELGLDGEDTLLCISRLEPLKMTDHVIRVVKMLQDRGRRVFGLLSGDGQLREEQEALARELGVADQILFLGNKDQIWLSRVIPKVSAVLSPFTGRALAEAALGQAPIVAYDIDWHSELIETGVTGELVPSQRYDLMADAVERFLDDKEYAARMGANVRRRALEMMDQEAADRAQIAVYEELLTGATAASG